MPPESTAAPVNEGRPVLSREEAEPAVEIAGPPPEAKLPSAGEEAFDYLIENSVVAATLANGGYETLNYSKWRVVQETSQEVWIDLVANWSTGGPDVHFIWAVEKEGGKAKPISQAARNLESDYRSNN
jgi:hypothetical protein